MSLKQEGELCKAALNAFTASIIARFSVPSCTAKQLRNYDDSRQAGNVYFYFPFCFRDAFEGVALNELRALALSGVLWMSYMRAQDDSLDRTTKTDPTVLFLRDLYSRESLSILYRIFPPATRFWELYSTYFDQYARSVLHEKTHHSRIESKYEEEEYHAIAKGKAAMAKYPVAAQAVLSGHYEQLPLLAESLDCFHIGYQYWDDLVDWSEDFTDENYSLLLVRAFERLSSEERKLTDAPLRKAIGQTIYYSGLANEHLSQASMWFERAYSLSSTAGCMVWASHVQALQRQTRVLAADLLSIMAKRL